MSRELYESALCAAFWAGVWRFRGPRERAFRFVIGLALGAVVGRVAGLMAVPLGLLLVAPLRAPGRGAFLAGALPALPLAFAVAKLGCVAAGCCRAALAEAVGFAALAIGLERVPREHAAPLALAGIGALRLALLPLRPGAELSGGFAAVWLLAAALRCGATRGGDRCLRPGNATSSRMAGSSRSGCAASSRARRTCV